MIAGDNWIRNWGGPRAAVWHLRLGRADQACHEQKGKWEQAGRKAATGSTRDLV